MSTPSSEGELNASAVIGLMQSGAYSRDVVETIARGFLPLEQDDLITVLTYLALSNDEKIQAQARHSLRDVPSRALATYASNESIEPEALERLMSVMHESYVLEALIRNRSVSDAAVVALAGRADAYAQEVIVINHARILRAPEILDALLANPSLTADTRRRVHETREEFFFKRERQAALEDEDLELLSLPLDDIADLLERAEQQKEETAPQAVALTESEKKDDSTAAIWAKIQFMTVADRVRLAFRGDRIVRMLMVRDRNKLICSAVMRNPRMSEQEAEAIAGMRNVDDEVLRILALRRDWMSKYKIMHTLVRNPKAPVGVVLPFVNRLTLRDLKGLKDDKGVQQVVRETARKAYLARGSKS